MSTPPTTRIGIDTGGTFTDVVRDGPRGRHVVKVPSTPRDPALAFLQGLEEAGGGQNDAHVHHGTTVGTNTVLTRSGARTVFVTTAGFEDLLEIGRGQRDDLHGLRPSRRASLVERAHCVGVKERIGANGSVLLAPTQRELARVRRAVSRAKPEAVAVCLLHATRNAQNEQAVRDALLPLGVPVHVSSEVSADPREFERAESAVLDAYVAPVVGDYVTRLGELLEGETLTVMRSDGGRMTAGEVVRAPVRTLLSGPAAGVAAARELAASLRLPRVLSFDVGGTSTDVAWIDAGDLPLRPRLDVGPYRAGVPSVALETVGAGGGSAVWIDAGGALRVGPQSAGADPGPACYGNGGPLALTDAWLLLDRLPDALLAGAFPLDANAARDAAHALASEARLSLRALCEGAVRVAAATTARALRLASVAQGNDPRDAALVAFGGAGPMLACETAELLGIDTIVVPANPGTFAAQGTLVSPLRADVAQVVDRSDDRSLDRTQLVLAKRVRRELEDEGAKDVLLRAEVDARYAGQAFEVTVPLKGWRKGFHDAYAARYGFATPQREITVTRVRVRGEGWEDEHRAAVRRKRTEPPAWKRKPLSRRGRKIPALRRETLDAGHRVTGPVRIEELSGTTFVPTDWRCECLTDGTLRLRRLA